MNKLTYKDIYNKTAYQAYGLLKDQYLIKAKPIYEAQYWGICGADYNYTPWGIPIYNALHDEWDYFKYHKFFDTHDFGGQTFTYKKYYWDPIFTSSMMTGLKSAVELIIAGISSLLYCYRRADKGVSFTSSQVKDMVYYDQSSSEMWKMYTTEWNVGTMTNDYISYNSWKLLGIHLQCAEVLFALSEIICSFNYQVVYSKENDLFSYAEVGD